MAVIDVGAAAIDRNSYTQGSYTNIAKDNPANASGSITSVEIYAVSGYDWADCEVATFEEVSTDHFTSRDSENLGAITSGSKQTFSGLDMDVQTGDYIGEYHSEYDGGLEVGFDGAGRWRVSGDQIPCTNVEFDPGGVVKFSLYGEGETAGVTEKSSSDTGSGADAKASGNPVATLSGAETGSGVDAVDSLETPEAKSSSDAGSGVEGTPVQSAVLAGSETGSGIEALIARLLAAVDTGYGVEAGDVEVEDLLKDLFATELGQGSDSLTAKIETPIKGGGMKLWN